MYHALNTLAHKLLPHWIYDRLIGSFNNHGFKRYASNTFWPLITRVIGMVVAFVTTIYTIRALGPENYGQLSYAVSFVGLFGILASLGIDNVLYRELINHPENRSKYLGSTLVIKFMMGLITAFIVVVAAFTLVDNDVSRLIILLLAPTFLGTALQTTLIADFGGQVAQKYPSLVTIAVILILSIAKIITIALGAGVLYLGAILLVEPFLYAILLFSAHRHVFGTEQGWRFDTRIAQSLIYESWPFIFTTAFVTIYSRIDQIMLKHFIDATATGLYDAAVRIAEVWYLFPSIIAASLFPAILNAKKTNPNEYRRRLRLLIVVLLIIPLVFIIPLTFIAKPLIVTIYGPAFLGSVAPFLVYLWAGIFVSLDNVTHWYLLAEKKRRSIFLITATAAILNTVLNLLFIPHYGLVGAAWATLISYAVLVLPLLPLIIYKDSQLK